MYLLFPLSLLVPLFPGIMLFMFSFIFHLYFHPLSLPPFRKENQDSLEDSLLSHQSFPKLLVLSSNIIHAFKIL